MTAAPRVRRIVETALDCVDLAKTVAFYRDLLDAAPMTTGERLVTFDAGAGTVLLLFQRGLTSGAVETPGGIVPGHTPGGPGHVAFAVDAADLPAWERRLDSLGIAIESRVAWDRGGTSLYFRDPDDRSVELATPGVWPSY